MASAAEQLAANVNWGAFAKADELKKRIWFTLGALIVYRLGTYIPLPELIPQPSPMPSMAIVRASYSSSICFRAAPCSAWRSSP